MVFWIKRLLADLLRIISAVRFMDHFTLDHVHLGDHFEPGSELIIMVIFCSFEFRVERI